MDYMCAEDISKTISRFSNVTVAAEEILRTHSKERAERVVTAIVNNSSADKFTAHREWASQNENKQQSEPSARNIEIFKNMVNISDVFIQAFRKAADGMIAVMFPIIDENGKRDRKPGWAHPSEIAKAKTDEKIRNEELSLKERLAAAERQAKEHNSNNSMQSRKTNRNNSHDL